MGVDALLGPVTGVFLSLPFLLAAAFLVVWTAGGSAVV
jgi:hypothetical protein